MRDFLLRTVRNGRGFTLVEMMFAILIGMIIMAAVTGVFITHSRTYTIHDDVAALQQSVRGVMMVMPAEFRMAGCDPMGSKKPKIETAEQNYFEFTADLGSDEPGSYNEADGEISTAGERVAYAFREGYDKCWGGKRGDGPGVLCRKVMPSSGKWDNTDFQILADDIEKLEFNYILWDYKAKKVTSSCEQDPGSCKLKSDDISKITAVQISLLVRGEFEDQKFYDNHGEFTAGSGRVWKLTDRYSGDELERERHHRRRLIVTTVQLRNLGGN